MKGRSGFSLAEILLVLVLIGLVSVLIIPKLGASYAKTQVAAARARITALAGRARLVAISRSCADTLHVSSGTNGVAWITVCAFFGAGVDTETVADQVASRYGVTIASSRNFVFDPRGMFISAFPSVVITKSSVSDSVVIGASGRVTH